MNINAYHINKNENKAWFFLQLIQIKSSLNYYFFDVLRLHFKQHLPMHVLQLNAT